MATTLQDPGVAEALDRMYTESREQMSLLRARRPDMSVARTVKERADTEQLNVTVKEQLAAKGLTFNQPDVAPFRDKLRSAGFYAEWKGKYGDHAWDVLEKAVGKLS